MTNVHVRGLAPSTHRLGSHEAAVQQLVDEEGYAAAITAAAAAEISGVAGRRGDINCEHAGARNSDCAHGADELRTARNSGRDLHAMHDDGRGRHEMAAGDCKLECLHDGGIRHRGWLD